MFCQLSAGSARRFLGGRIVRYPVNSKDVLGISPYIVLKRLWK